MGGHSWLTKSVLAAQVGSPWLWEELANLGLRQESAGQGLSRSNRGAWHSVYLETSSEVAIVEARQQLEALAQHFLAGTKQLGNRQQRSGKPSVRVQSLWINIHRGRDRSVAHRHAQLGSLGEDTPMISGVMYLRANSSSAAQLCILGEESSNDSELLVEPRSGTAVFFPATTLHDVRPRDLPGSNDSDVVCKDGCEARISLAFNMCVRWPASALDEAATAGNRTLVASLLAARADMHSVDQDGFSAVVHAAEAGHVAVVQLLTDSSANPHEATQSGSQAVHLAAILAAIAGHRPVVELLTEVEPTMLQAAAGAETPLHAAAANGDCNLVQHLVNHGANVQSRRADGCEPVHAAVLNGHASALSCLLALRADPNSADASGLRPIHEALRGGLKQIAHDLIYARADVLASDDQGYTPLYWIAHGGHVPILEWFVAANFSAADLEWNSQKQAVSAAKPSDAPDTSSAASTATIRSEAMADYLAAAMMSRGGALQTEAKHMSPLHAAAAEGHVTVASWLLDHRAELLRPTPSSRVQPLHLAADEGHVPAIQWLLNARAAINAAARGRIAPLHMAASQGHRKAIELLLSRRASLQTSASDGSQPLHLAAHRGHVGSMEVLLRARATASAKTRQGEQPLHKAAEGSPHHYRHLSQMLMQHRADPEARSREGLRPIDVLKAADHLADSDNKVWAKNEL